MQSLVSETRRRKPESLRTQRRAERSARTTSTTAPQLILGGKSNLASGTERRRPDKHSNETRLTDIIVALALAELLAQGEGREPLELLGELLRGVGCERVAALPAHLVVGLGLAGVVVLLLHHVEDVALSVLRRHLAQRVVGTHDVQVVVELHLHRVVVPHKPDGRRGGSEREEERGTEG